MPDFKASFQPDETMTADFGETNVLGEEVLIPGPPGKSAYEYAQDGGYTGTEKEFAKKLMKIFVSDTTIGTPNFGTNGARFRAGVTYKYFVSKAWWNVGGVVNAE